MELARCLPPAAAVSAATIDRIIAAATVAAPRIGRRSRYGYAEGRYPSHTENLCSDVAESIGENDRYYRQAPYQKSSDAFSKDHCHAYHPSRVHTKISRLCR